MLNLWEMHIFSPGVVLQTAMQSLRFEYFTLCKHLISSLKSNDIENRAYYSVRQTEISLRVNKGGKCRGKHIHLSPSLGTSLHPCLSCQWLQEQSALNFMVACTMELFVF